MKVKYKIYRCYEITIEDKDGNQVRESEFIYTTRTDAKKRAEEMLKETEKGLNLLSEEDKIHIAYTYTYPSRT